jgi:hypothetical protein
MPVATCGSGLMALSPDSGAIVRHTRAAWRDVITGSSLSPAVVNNSQQRRFEIQQPDKKL